MYRTIVCAIGNGPRETAERILNKAAGLLDEDGSIFVIHAVETMPHYMTASLPEDFETAAIKDAEEKLTLLCRQMKIPALVEVHTGSAARVLLAAARRKRRTSSSFQPMSLILPTIFSGPWSTAWCVTPNARSSSIASKVRGIS